MTFKEIILSIVSGAGIVLSAIFYVLFKQAKEERLREEKERAEAIAKTKADALNATNNAINSVNEEKTKIEEKIETAASNNLNSFNAGIDLLRK